MELTKNRENTMTETDGVDGEAVVAFLGLQRVDLRIVDEASSIVSDEHGQNEGNLREGTSGDVDFIVAAADTGDFEELGDFRDDAAGHGVLEWGRVVLFQIFNQSLVGVH